jgi:hypothetical protein
VDADFLTFYRIDLRDPDTRISAESFFARAFRLFAYRGAMRQELQAEVENNTDPQPAYTAPAAVAPAPAAKADSDGTRWVSPGEMKSLFPDLF